MAECGRHDGAVGRRRLCVHDTNRWTDGLPAPGKVAVIDAAGANYTVNLNMSVTASGIVVDHTNAVLRPTANVTVNAPVELRTGRFEIPVSQSLTLNRPLVNHDRLRWVTRYNTFNLQGSGRVENLGLWELYKDPLNDFGYESIVGVPVNVPAGGKLLLSTNALVVFTQPSSLTVAGELEIQQGARLRLDGSAPARDLTLLPGSQLSGAGTLRLEGANRIALEGSITSGIGLLEMSGSSSISGAFTLTVASGSTLRFDHSSTIPGSITVEGTLTLTSPSVVVTINGRLTLNAAACSTTQAPSVLRLASSLTTAARSMALRRRTWLGLPCHCRSAGSVSPKHRQRRWQKPDRTVTLANSSSPSHGRAGADHPTRSKRARTSFIGPS